MDIRYVADPVRYPRMTTAEIRENMLVESLFQPGRLEMVYCDVDRAIVGSVVPTDKPLELSGVEQLRCDYFCQRRELGVLNLGEPGVVTVDGTDYELDTLDCLYIGMGSKAISFSSKDGKQPAVFYLISFPAHQAFPTTKASRKDSQPVHLGSREQANERTIYKYIHPDGIKSCQLCLGFTELEPGCVWNTMPP
ncbi:MAG: 5-dehydro-4-deoxy-D-glucuronate isomerase, partial [Sedimentisphaerales bacterium]|nr:5-dehydro-4-deoxy-D-glucuronate isomerase [Sedimentisphaerales bacterium]